MYQFLTSDKVQHTAAFLQEASGIVSHAIIQYSSSLAVNWPIFALSWILTLALQ